MGFHMKNFVTDDTPRSWNDSRRGTFLLWSSTKHNSLNEHIKVSAEGTQHEMYCHIPVL